ncbi:MAG: FtsX-like permease family protein, partial [Planctomycetota bacterium]
ARGLRSELEGALPDAAPSVFLVDVQPDQWGGLRDTLDATGASNIDSVPVVMARLSAVGEAGVESLSRTRPRSDRWVFSREQRLTWLEELPEDNVITEGALWSDPDELEVSLEEEFAARIGAEVGSRLTFDLQGIPVELLVTSLRSVDWRSFAINFFIVVEPGVLEEAPHFRIAAARFSGSTEENELQDRVAEAYPNISVVPLRPILEKLSGVLTKLALGVRLLGAFTVLSGLAILAGAVASTALRRRREAALLKVLGSKKGQIRSLFATEYALVGAVAGALGACGAALLAHLFLTQQLELDAPKIGVPILLAIGATAVLATLCGLAASRKALDAPALEGLRGL